MPSQSIPPPQAGKIQDSISLVNEQHPALLDNDRYLLFHLQQQHLIELIREQVCTAIPATFWNHLK